MHIASDRQLTLNFELRVEIFMRRHVSINYEDFKIVFVCPYPKERNHPSFINISPAVVIDTSMERFTRLLQHGKPKI